MLLLSLVGSNDVFFKGFPENKKKKNFKLEAHCKEHKFAYILQICLQILSTPINWINFNFFHFIILFI